jgi:uncharacterized membrane protein
VAAAADEASAATANERDEPVVERFDHGRTVALSDGVFAIALTLLVLNIDQPNASGSFADKLDQLRPEIFAYALSFLVLSVMWLRHHQFFAVIARVDSRLVSINLAYLGFVAFMPFPTGLLADQSGKTYSVALYAAAISLTVTIAIVMRLYATHKGLARPGAKEQSLGQAAAVPIVFGASIPIAFASPDAAQLTWLLLIPFGALQRG